MEHITSDIGSRIRQAREQRGLTLLEVANATKISMTALVAIEQNEFDRLPGGVFRRGYLRAFAIVVGLDADDLTREYRARYESESPAEPLPRHTPGWYGRVQAIHRLSALLAAAGVLIGGLAILTLAQIFRDRPADRPRLDAVEQNLGAEATPIDEPHAVGAVPLANADVSPDAVPLRLEIRLNRLCWVSASADGERRLYRLMQPGERTVIEARRVITLSVGDAGAVDYSINGAAGRPLGRSGEVVTVRITDDSRRSPVAEPI